MHHKINPGKFVQKMFPEVIRVFSPYDLRRNQCSHFKLEPSLMGTFVTGHNTQKAPCTSQPSLNTSTINSKLLLLSFQLNVVHVNLEIDISTDKNTNSVFLLRDGIFCNGPISVRYILSLISTQFNLLIKIKKQLKIPGHNSKQD